MFNIGAKSDRAHSSSSSQSSSLGLGYGYQGSESLSDSLQRARSVSGGQATSSQGIAFEDLFRELYGGAAGAASKVAALAPGLNEQASLLFSGGLGFLDQLQQRDDSVVNAQIDALGEDLGRFLREDVNPELAARGVATGTLGGGRQGVAQGAAARSVLEQFTRGATGLRAADRTARDQAAVAGLTTLPGLFDVARGGFGNELAPYESLAAIMGGPLALTTSQSTQFGESTSDAIAQALSRAFGEDFSYDASQSSSESQSRSKSKSFSFGMGGGGGTS